VDATGQPYAYTGDDPVNGVDPLGLCSTQGSFLVSGACHWTSKSWVAQTETTLQSQKGGGGFWNDLESDVERYDPAYQAIKDYDDEYHAVQDGCSLLTDFAFAGKAVVADVETGASVDGEGEVADTVDVADGGLSGGVTRVGRWMSPTEYDAMSVSGTVQEGAGGVTSVSNPADPEVWMRQTASGSKYAEFDVPTDSLTQGGKAGWATIRGPNSWFARYGMAQSEMPSATDIEWIASKL
jgi:hypothetical protein